MNGLTDGISSRYLRANRSELLPSLARLRQTYTERNVALHGRLEELLCFEIMKDGATDYHRFTVRTLHKYVMNAIKTPNPFDSSSPRGNSMEGKAGQELLNRLALGRAIVHGGGAPISEDDNKNKATTADADAATDAASSNITKTSNTSDASTTGGGISSLSPIDETEPFDSHHVPTIGSIFEKDIAGFAAPGGGVGGGAGGGAAAVTYRERLGGFLHPRDMRKLVTPFSASNEPELIIRRHTILMNFDPLRAIILRDRLIVLVPDGADSILVQLEKRVLGGSDAGSDAVANGGMSRSESNASLEEYGNGSMHSAAGGGGNGVNNNLANLETKLEQIKEDQPLGGDDDNDDEINEESKKANSTASTDASTEPLLNETSETEKPTTSTNNNDNNNLGIDIDMNIDEQEYLNQFADNEWEELDGKDWIDLPFELQCADAVLHCVCAILADDVLDLQLAANGMISELLHPGADVGDHAQDVLRTMKNSIKEMMSRVDGFCRALDTLLEDYEDMALMNLSRLLTHPDRFVQPVPQSILDEESDEPELILEAHLQRGHTLKNGLNLVQGQIISTEDFAIRKSDTIRNRLLYINMVISVLSLSVSLGSFVGSIFGMNVINHFEDNPNAFRTVVFSTIGGSFAFVALVLFTIRKLGALPNLLG